MNEKKSADGKLNSYKISGMHCAMCVKSVENAIKKVNGVLQVEVNLGTETAYVNSSGLNDVGSIKNAIEDAGYGLIMDEITLNIQGMHCAMCVKSIEQALTVLKGVFSVDIDLTAETAHIKYLSESITISEIKEAVAKSGYKVSSISGETDPAQERKKKRALQNKLILSVIGIITGVVLMVLMYSGIHIFPLLQFVITLPLLIILGGPIFKAAYLSLANRALTMDVMYSMGMGVALISSFLAMLNVLPQRGFLFFDTVLMLSSFLTLGRYLEEKAKGGTGAAIRKLMQLSPSEVLVIKDGVEMRIAAVELVPGDIVLCRHGEKVPADGDIIEGKAYIDESMLTGESISVKKSVGDKVIGGTLNTNGFIKVRVDKVGAETVLSQIIRVVQEAQLSKPQLQKLADNVVSYFIPVVFIIAVLTFLIWKFMIGSPLDMALTRLISVLVVACPCALGLATPTAVTTGIGRGAQLGILIKNGDALENSARIDVAVFDKTGTLTLGEPGITSLMTIKGDADKIKLKTGSLERYTSHPFASTISGEFLISGEEPLDAKDIRVLEGKGISGNFANQVFMIGSFEYYSEYESPSEELVSKVDHVIDLGESPVLCWDADSLMLMGISDPIKPDASKAVGELQQMGLDVFMITGD
ncbi:MAG: heavy metal translocating P-type ATPase, partial [Desulfobulbaceae bacterium]|nr:heavy metal translocating P-type ATPase [Desulfobulbaceae bacterium]